MTLFRAEVWSLVSSADCALGEKKIGGFMFEQSGVPFCANILPSSCMIIFSYLVAINIFFVLIVNCALNSGSFKMLNS